MPKLHICTLITSEYNRNVKTRSEPRSNSQSKHPSVLSMHVLQGNYYTMAQQK